MKNRFVFLKMDACTRMETVQFMNNNVEVIIYTLAVKDTNANHSSESIKKIVCDVLDRYDLKKEQILDRVLTSLQYVQHNKKNKSKCY